MLGATGKLGLSAGHRRQALTLADTIGQVLASKLREPGLVVPKIELAGCAIHVEIDQRLGFGLKMAAGPATQDERAADLCWSASCSPSRSIRSPVPRNQQATY